MATTTRDIFGLWDCTSCYARGIYGPARECPSCGNPREADELAGLYLPPRDPVTNEVLGHAFDVRPEHRKGDEGVVGGPDWSCKYCGGTNGAQVSNCLRCGALGDHAKFELRPVVAEEPVPFELPALPSVTGNFAEHSWGPVPPAVREGLSQRATAPAKSNLGWILVCLLILATISFLIWGFHTHPVPATVEAMHWEHTTWRQTFTQVSAEDWCYSVSERPARMPVNGVGEVPGAHITHWRMKHHHYDQVPDGTEQVAHTRQVQSGSRRSCSHSNNGNGTFRETCVDIPTYTTETYYTTETKYRDVSVEKRWCTYDTWTWRDDRGGNGLLGPGQRTLDGDGPGEGELAWPSVGLGPLDRQQRKGRWTITVGYKKRGESLKVVAEEHGDGGYKRWAVGEQGVVHLRNFGSVASVTRENFKPPPGGG